MVYAETSLCSGNSFSTCKDAGYTTHQYDNHNTTPWWGAIATTGHNCTNYVGYMLTNVNGLTEDNVVGDASYWDTYATTNGITMNGAPAVGAIAQWDNYGASGHIAYVEAVSNDGSTITVSEDTYEDGPFAWRTINSDDPNWPEEFIHFNDLIDAPSMYTGSNGDIWIAGVTKYGELYTRRYDASTSSWGSASSRGSNYSTKSSPAITKASDGKVWLTAVKIDGELMVKYFDGSWHNPSDPIAEGLSIDAGVRMVPRSDGDLTILFVKADGNIYHKTGDETGWSNPGPHWSGNWSITSTPGLTVDSEGTMWAAAVKSGGSYPGHLYVWKITSNGDVKHDATASSQEYFNDFSKFGGIDLIGRSNGNVTLVAIDQDENFHHKTLNADMESVTGASIHGSGNWSVYHSPSVTVDNSGDVWIAAVKNSGDAYTYRTVSGSFRSSPTKINLTGPSFFKTAGLDIQPRTNGSVTVAGVNSDKEFVHRTFYSNAWGNEVSHFD